MRDIQSIVKLANGTQMRANASSARTLVAPSSISHRLETRRALAVRFAASKQVPGSAVINAPPQIRLAGRRLSAKPPRARERRGSDGGSPVANLPELLLTKAVRSLRTVASPCTHVVQIGTPHRRQATSSRCGDGR